jgi:tetratricopeptide (TPR) repeat protein
VPELRVIARTSSFSFKGKDVDIDDIARRLNVANVLEGSVRRSGDKLRITAQLVRASDSSHLWSHTYDRKFADVFAVQDEIAGTIVRELKIRLLGKVPTTRETDPRAYALFLQARQIGRQFTEVALARAIELYQQSLAIDPTYTAAWVGLAGAYFDQVNTGLRPADEGIGPAREAAAKALALDPQYAPVHARLAWIAMYYDRDLAAAARHLEQALALEPSNPDIIGAAANLARRLGRLHQAIALGRYQLARDPANSDGHYDLGLAYRYAGRLDEAIASFRTVLSLVPANIGSHATISEMLLQKDDPKAALMEIEQEPDEQWRLPVLSMVYHALGRRSESDAALAEVMKKYERTGSLYIASVLALRGENDRAFAWLDKAIQHHDIGLGAVPVYPTLAGLHSDPRWLPLLRRLSMAPDQLAAIKFDVKAPP